MKSDQLCLMARKLAEMVRRMPKLDWTQRESVRADLRRIFNDRRRGYNPVGFRLIRPQAASLMSQVQGVW